MPLKNIGDATYANLWSNALSSLRSGRIVTPREAAKRFRRGFNRHDYKNAQSNPMKPSRHFQRLMRYPDHHQLNIMDYVKYLSDTGIYPLNWEATNATHTKFELNPKDHGSRGNHLSSVYITLAPHYQRGSWDSSEGRGKIAKYARYHGRPLANATFIRFSNNDGTNKGSYGYNDGFDSLGNFMLMIHNHILAGKGVPADKLLTPSAKDARTRRWLHVNRWKFAKNYAKLYGTYRTQFPLTGAEVGNKTGVAHGDGRKRTIDDGKYHDIPMKYRDHPKKGNPRGWWNPNFSAYKYLNKVRGIPKDIIHYELTNDLLRSYSGSIRYDVFRNVDPEELSKLKDSTTKKVPVVFSEKDYQRGIETGREVANGHAVTFDPNLGPRGSGMYVEKGAKASDVRRGYKVVPGKRYSSDSHYDAKTKTFYGVKSEYHPMVEFPWKKPERRPVAMDPKRSSAMIRKYGIKAVKTNHSSKPAFTVKGHPNIRVATKITNANGKTTLHPEFAYEMKLTGHDKTVGSDRIYLNSDEKHGKSYASKPYMVKGIGKAQTVTRYMPTDGTVAKQMFSRGKQISKHPEPDYGYNFSVGTGKDRLYLFEDPIDVNAYYASNRSKLSHTNSTFVSLGGVTKLGVINNIMKIRHIDPKDIYICFDNDPAGHRNALKILAADKSKIHNDIHHDPANNGHRIHVVVPGGVYDSYHHITGKALSGDLGEHHWKDCDDNLECEMNRGVYKGKVSYGTRLAIRRDPQAILNPSQFSKMVVNNGMMSAGPQNTQAMQLFFGDYYHFGESIRDRSLAEQKQASSMMRRNYRSMDKRGQHSLGRLMNGDGKYDEDAKYISPKDLAICANHYPGARVIRNIHIRPAHVYSRKRYFSKHRSYYRGHRYNHSRWGRNYDYSRSIRPYRYTYRGRAEYRQTSYNPWRKSSYRRRHGKAYSPQYSQRKKQGMNSPKWQRFIHRQTAGINARRSARQQKYTRWRRQAGQRRHAMRTNSPKRAISRTRQTSPSWQR